MKWRRFLSAICSLALMITVAMPTAFAADEPIVDDEKYDFVVDDIAYKKVGDSTVEVSVYQKVMPPTANNAGAFVSSLYDGQSITIPGTVTNESTEYTVVGIGYGAFASSKPTSVTLPENAESFTYIGDHAFDDCTLSSLTIPASVTEIQDSAFAWGSNFTSISFAETSQLQSIGNNAFAGCSSLSSLTLPDSVQSIGSSVFGGCSALESITIPASVTDLDPAAFSSTGSYGDSYYGEGKIQFAEGCKYKIQDGILYDNESLLNVYEVKESVTVPEGIKYIGDNAFQVMPASSTDDTLTSITFPSTLVSIGDNAFQRNTGLTSITIPSDVTDLGTGVFLGCSGIAEVTIEAALDEIPDYTFSGTSITSIDLPDSVTKIGTHAFEKCDDLTSIEIPDSVTEIGVYAFSECTQLASVELSAELKTLGQRSFFKCSTLTSVEIPEGVSRIENVTFGNCTALNTVILPSAIEYVGANAFGNALTGENAVLVMKGTTPPENFDAKAFGVSGGQGKVLEDLTVIVPDGSESAYAENTTLSTYVKDETSGDNTKPGISYKLEMNETLSIVNGESVSIGTAIVPEGWKFTIDPSSNDYVSISGPDTESGAITATATATGNVELTFSITDSMGSIVLDEQTCKITVTDASVPATGIALDRTEAWLYSNTSPRTVTLTATVTPTNSTDTVTWSSSDETVATVENGVVTAVGNGTATITATAGAFKATCTVYVTTYTSGGGGSSTPTYTVSVEDPDNGSIRVSPSRAERGDTVTITVTPDDGYELDRITITDADGDKIDVERVSSTRYTFEMPRGRVTVEAEFVAIEEEPEPEPTPDLPFVDVSESAWYYDAVAYCYENGLMAGTSGSTFAPDTTTSRGMIVTILYRLDGTQAVSGTSGFADVAAGQYYADAVAWASANGIVGGYGNGNFGPNDPITREQMAAILYRYAQYKGYDTSASADLSVFADAGQISAYAVPALQWANAEGLINGTSTTTISPDGSGTRAQIAVILMRFCERFNAI